MEVCMAVEVVRRVTLAAVTGRGRRSVGGRTVTNCTAVVLFDICSVDEVDVIDGGAVTAVTFGLQRHQAGVVLGAMGGEVAGDITVTLRTVTCCRAGQLGDAVVTGVAGVMLGIIGQADKADVINGAGVTAGTTGRLGDLAGMVFSVGGPVSGHTAVAGATIDRSSADGTVGGMTGCTIVMLFIIGQINKALTCC